MGQITNVPSGVGAKPSMYHVAVDTDTWQKIACHAKYADLVLAGEPYTLFRVGDTLVFDDINNPYPKCLCKVTGIRWFRGFRSAFESVSAVSLGYIMGDKNRASYKDFENNYAVNDIIQVGVLAVTWELMSCEYVKYTKNDSKKSKPSKKGKQESPRTEERQVRQEPEQVVEEPPAEEMVEESGPVSKEARQELMNSKTFEQAATLLKTVESLAENPEIVAMMEDFGIKPVTNPDGVTVTWVAVDDPEETEESTGQESEQPVETVAEEEESENGTAVTGAVS